jgi:branched-chain amino acid transport system substrate-binding protein
MARDKVNADGGILGHPIELIDINEHAADLRPELAIEETVTAMDDGAQFLVGGFRSEVCFPLREAVMDYAADYGRPIWFVTGAATDDLIDCGYDGLPLACGACVRNDYERYKYIFRNTPMNSTFVGAQIFYYIRYHVLPILVGIYGSPIKTALICEDLVSWDKPFAAVAGADYAPEILPGVPNMYVTPPSDLPPTAEGTFDPRCLLGPDCDMEYVTRPSQYAEDFQTELDNVETIGARLIIEFFSATGGISFSRQWGELETPAVVIGVNVEGQAQTFWDSTSGYCEYESFVNSMGTSTPIVPGLTDKFWRDYYDNYGSYPIYTGFAAYDSIIAIKETIEEAETWPMTSEEMIPLFESGTRLSILGQTKYTGPDGIYHDVWVHSSALTDESYGDPPYVRALLVQWQGGRQEAIRPADQEWSKKYAIPPWMYADIVQDPGDDPPFGDVTYDGAVDIFDVVTTAGAFGSTPGGALENPNPDWDIRADVKKDGSVDIFDIVTIAADFGESISLPLP